MIVIDNFLPQREFKIFNESWVKVPTGTWMTRYSEPDGFLEYVARKLWSIVEHQLPKTISGYEYWTNTLTDTVGLDWHYDKDEVLYEMTGEIVTPFYGSVLYGDGDVTGGYLEIEQSDGEIERIAYKPNRAILFNAGLYRHRVSPIKSGVRKTLACNIWEKELM